MNFYVNITNADVLHDQKKKILNEHKKINTIFLKRSAELKILNTG